MHPREGPFPERRTLAIGVAGNAALLAMAQVAVFFQCAHYAQFRTGRTALSD
jgi:hypothetical protein